MAKIPPSKTPINSVGTGGTFRSIIVKRMAGTRNKSGLVLNVSPMAIFTFSTSPTEPEKS